MSVPGGAHLNPIGRVDSVKKGEVLEGKVTDIAFPNQCLVTVPDEERPVEVKDGLIGQTVRLQLCKVRKGRAQGRILEVLQKAPDEVAPACPHFGACGGCTYQNLPYASQLALKERQVLRLLSEACGELALAGAFEGIFASPETTAYRNKMEFSFGDAYRDGPLALGMHRRGSFYDIVTVGNCAIVDADFQKILTCVLDYFTQMRTDFYHKMRHTGYLRHLLVRKGKQTQEILVDLVTSTQFAMPGMTEAELLRPMAERLRLLPLDGTLVGVLHTRNDSLADVIQNDGTDILYGQDFFYEEICGLRFRITPFSFFQTNSLGAQALYEKVRAYAGDTKDATLFDLYSGTGTIGQILAPAAKKVVGIEIVEEAVMAARANAAENNLKNCQFLAGDVGKTMERLQETPDIVVLDPPREGVHPKALAKIATEIRPQKLIYISCKPTSLARDIGILMAGGYRMERACCVDMFPGTVHVETVVLMSRVQENRIENP